ncbi:MAG: UvrD-helicase domain-containing protein [Candidatus Woesearchaeota archaeon]
MPNGKELEYLSVLKALDEIPFGIGKKLLIEFLQGKKNNESIVRNKLHLKQNFGSMAYENDELNDIIDNLIMNDMIQLASLNSNKFWKVMELSPKGKKEICTPSLYKRKLAYNFKETKTLVTEEDKRLFNHFEDILSGYDDAQKKSIISNKKHILCLAGAGSGKTTVLTKRIEFLMKYRSVDPGRILAITFTRKARQEMMRRLGDTAPVKVETFNSFCEKILRQHNDQAYDKPVRVIDYRDRILMIKKALSKLNIDIRAAINIYFSSAQQRTKTEEQLINIFMNDCFFLRDYFKFKNKPIDETSFDIGDAGHEKSVKMVIGICKHIEANMKKHGLRDFADQLVDTINLFEGHKNLIPQFDHILIDEYQDVNSTQIHLVDLLSPENVFCVGDPRQSIYGWRGSDIRYILNFKDKYPDCEMITLTKNYRSTRHIVELINDSIKNMRLADLESSVEEKEDSKDIKLLKFNSEDAEFEFVIQMILASDVPRNEIFVLARTNRQLNELSQIMKIRGISHVVRNDEMRKKVIAGENDVTLATIHAIKGMEADKVFVIGCTSTSFPCKGSEHPVIDMVKIEEYDKEEEERRLLYVAMSRAKKNLCMTYTGNKHTSFITDNMLNILDEKTIEVKPQERSRAVPGQSGSNLMARLKEWRNETSKMLGVPAFMIMHDRTLIDIAQKTPLTVKDLEDIHGLGPTKIMKYGEDILSLVSV